MSRRIFRIDHFLGKRPVDNMLVFRFANAFSEAFSMRIYIESVQITLAEDFGVQGRGAFYDATGAIRDVVQNHLFQVLSNLAMEPPVRSDGESLRDEKVKVLKAIPPIEEKNLIRGQFDGYRNENGVASKILKLETFAALRLEVNSWRWKGVPFYIRAGKCLPLTYTEIFSQVPQASHRNSRGCSVFELSPVPDQPGCRNRNGHDGHASRRELSRPVGRDDRKPAAHCGGNGRVRKGSGRCHGWRRHSVRTGRLRGGSLENRRSGSEERYSCLFIRAKELGAE